MELEFYAFHGEGGKKTKHVQKTNIHSRNFRVYLEFNRHLNFLAISINWAYREQTLTEALHDQTSLKREILDIIIL